MPGRIRGAAVALGLIIGLPGALAQEQIEPAIEGQPEPSGGQEDSGQASQQEATPEQGRSPDLLPAIQSIESAIRGLIPQENQRERQWQEYREKADLRAQERMALWAFWMTVASLASVGLTAAGVLLIWRTLIHTRHAAEAAAASVDEAREIATITRDLGIRQIRAYVSMSTATIRNFKMNARPEIELRIRNSGQSPASRLRMIGNVRIGPPALVTRIEFGPFDRTDVSVTALHAGETFTAGFPLVDILDSYRYELIMRRDQIAVLAGYISYRDAFLKQRPTIFKAILDIDSLSDNGEAGFAASYKGNRAT